jgi:hypothetical protein
MSQEQDQTSRSNALLGTMFVHPAFDYVFIGGALSPAIGFSMPRAIPSRCPSNRRCRSAASARSSAGGTARGRIRPTFDSSEGRGLLNAQGEQLLPKNSIGMGPHWIHNVRLAYLTPDESIDVALGLVRNVTDEAVKAFPADLTTFQKTTLHFVGDPRTFGVTTFIRF